MPSLNSSPSVDPRDPSKQYKLDLLSYSDTIVSKQSRGSKYQQYDTNTLYSSMSDITAFISLLLGGTAMLLKNKYLAWLSLYTCISSICTHTNQSVDYKQNFASVSFSLMILLINYFGAIQVDNNITENS